MTTRLTTVCSPGDAVASGRSAAVSSERIREAFGEFVGDARFPCLAAKTTLRPDDEHLRVYGVLGSVPVSDALAADLARFARQAASAGNRLTRVRRHLHRPAACERARVRAPALDPAAASARA